MRKYKLVTKKVNEFVGLVCDECGKTLYDDRLELHLVTFGEDSEYHFCSYSCLLKFIVEELKKETPVDERFIYGNEENS